MKLIGAISIFIASALVLTLICICYVFRRPGETRSTLERVVAVIGSIQRWWYRLWVATFEAWQVWEREKARRDA